MLLFPHTSSFHFSVDKFGQPKTQRILPGLGLTLLQLACGEVFSSQTQQLSYCPSLQAAYFSVDMDKTDMLHPSIMTSEHIITITNLVKQWVSVPK